MKKIKSVLALFAVIFSGMMVTSCYTVFSGGTGGLIVDAESTSTPKSGIANVDVYAYTSQSDRDSDFDKWSEGTVFVPTADYYGHTSTGSDGTFTISKLVWKENKPDFWRDGDYTDIFLLYYHENYGLTKDKTVIVSDSTSDTVYAELKAVRKTTNLTLNFKDVSNDALTSNEIYAKISVPQTTQKNTTATAKVYELTVSGGSGSISVSYPRYQSDDDKNASKETEPVISVSYVQSADEITWQGCFNGDNEDGDYSFRSDAETGIAKTIKNINYSLTFYGKAIKLSVPTINGQYTAASGASASASENSSYGSQSDDGVIISLKLADSSGSYTIDGGQVTTTSQTVGTSSTEKHGVFSGLGSGSYWTDSSYTGKFSTIKAQVIADDATGTSKEIELRSNDSSYNVQL